VLFSGNTPLYLSQKDAYIEKEIKIASDIKKNTRLLKEVFFNIELTSFFTASLSRDFSGIALKNQIILCLKFNSKLTQTLATENKTL